MENRNYCFFLIMLILHSILEFCPDDGKEARIQISNNSITKKQWNDGKICWEAVEKRKGR